MKKQYRISIMFVALFCIIHQSVWATEVKINDTRKGNFYLDALKLVLEKSGKEHKLVVQGHEILSQARNIKHVSQGITDILYAGTSQELEKKLLPIRFPVTRGLIGHRVFIIHKDHQAEFDAVKSLDDLKKYEGLQGLGWGDTEVLEASGLKQYVRKYDDIFRMINAGRLHYFPRGITEIYHEITSRQEEMPNLVVEKNILLVYPTAVFFFVNRSNTELADTITAGFLNAYKDGSYKQFFYKHPMIESAIARSDLNKRIRIEIPNPFLSSETSAISKEYWHQGLADL